MLQSFIHSSTCFTTKIFQNTLLLFLLSPSFLSLPLPPFFLPPPPFFYFPFLTPTLVFLPLPCFPSPRFLFLPSSLRFLFLPSSLRFLFLPSSPPFFSLTPTLIFLSPHLCFPSSLRFLFLPSSLRFLFLPSSLLFLSFFFHPHPSFPSILPLFFVFFLHFQMQICRGLYESDTILIMVFINRTGRV